MKILLATPFMSEFDAGKYMIKALIELGHWVVPWDFRLCATPPTKDCDLLIVNKGPIPLTWNLVCDSTSVLYYPDDMSYPGNRELFERYAPDYDFVFTQNFYKAWEHLPLGCDPDIHRKIDNITPEVRDYYGADVAFIGTLRDQKRLEFVKEFRRALPEECTFKIWGNGWEQRIRPAYFNDFALVCNTTKIIINQHYSEISPNRKTFEIPACGGALMLAEKEAIGVHLSYADNSIYYDNAEHAAELAIEFILSEAVRKNLVEVMQKIAYNYTYKRKLEKMLKGVGI